MTSCAKGDSLSRWDPIDGEIHVIQRYPDDPCARNMDGQVPGVCCYQDSQYRHEVDGRQDDSDNTHGDGNNPSANSLPILDSLSEEVCPGYVHGFSVIERFSLSDAESTGYFPENRLSRIKLLLDDNPVTQDQRQGLRETLRRIGKSSTEVIRDYLTMLMLLAKQELTDSHGLEPESKGMCLPS